MCEKDETELISKVPPTDPAPAPVPATQPPVPKARPRDESVVIEYGLPMTRMVRVPNLDEARRSFDSHRIGDEPVTFWDGAGYEPPERRSKDASPLLFVQRGETAEEATKRHRE